jgi:hypothetical protein
MTKMLQHTTRANVHGFVAFFQALDLIGEDWHAEIARRAAAWRRSEFVQLNTKKIARIREKRAA